MKKPLGLRRRHAVAWLAPTLVLLSLPGACRADLLVNDFVDNDGSKGAACLCSGHVAPAVTFCSHGSAPQTPTVEISGAGLFALFGVCVHPPIPDPQKNSGSGSGGTTHHSGGGGGTIIGGEGGGGGVTTASTTPEPTALLIGALGAGAVGLAEMLRRKQPPRIA